MDLLFAYDDTREEFEMWERLCFSCGNNTHCTKCFDRNRCPCKQCRTDIPMGLKRHFFDDVWDGRAPTPNEERCIEDWKVGRFRIV